MVNYSAKRLIIPKFCFKQFSGILLFLLLLPISGISAPLLYQVPAQAPDLYKVQQDLIQYHDSGEYEREIQAVMTMAQKQLKDIIAKIPKEKNAIILDIDETALSNWVLLKKMTFYYAPARWKQWINEAKAIPIKPVQEFYKYALKNGITVFFVTGREQDEREVTEKNLKNTGYTEYQTLYLKSENRYKNVADYKTHIRKRIKNQGYNIVMTIGDQYSDLCGGYADVLIKLPNPFYFIPGCSADVLN